MAVTRKGESSLALQLEFLNRWRPGERRREFPWLLGASVLVAVGLALVLFAKTQNFPAARQRLAAGELLNLNAPTSAESLNSVLNALFTNSSDRNLAASRLTAFLEQHRPVSNVGALAWLRQPSPTARSPSTVAVLPVSKLKPFVVVRTPREFFIAFAQSAALYLFAFWFVHAAWRWRGFRGDPAILPALHLLTGIGLILMVSLRDPLRDTLEFKKFAFGVALGCFTLLLPLFRFFHYRYLAGLVYTPLLTALALFGALLRFGSGPTGSDARVNLGPFQPVEIIKLLLVLFMAGYFAANWERLRDLRQKRFLPAWLRWLHFPRINNLLPVIFGVACALLLFFILKDMGPALVMGVLFLSLFAVARKSAGLASLGMAAIIGGVAIGYHFGTPHTVVDRVSMWLSPWNNNVHGGDQLAHSLWAFATGGPWGSGPGWGDPGLIPAGHTDLVLPALAEEWGFCGVAAICLLFALLVGRAFRVALRAPDDYSLFLASGLGMLVALEMLLISGGALGAIPLSGVVSPFLSSGNTAMLSNFLIFAVLLGISNQSAREELPLEIPDRNPSLLRPLFGWPIHVVASVLGLFAISLLARAAYLEIWHSDELLARDALVYTADGVKRPQHNPRLNLLAAEIPRGNIYDRNGILLATSSCANLKTAQPSYDRLGVPVAACSPAFSRHYPFGPATLQLIGDLRTGERFHATNASLIEHDSNQRLQGYSSYGDLASVVRYRHQSQNPALEALLERDRDVHSTIDIRFQLQAASILKNAVAPSGKKGALVVMNPQTGDLLAVVSWPAPEIDGQSSSPDELFDRARYGEYPPGSTFKLVTAMAALRLDPAATARIFSCRRLSDGRAGIVIPGWRRPIRDDIGDRVHGSLNMANAITVSCNAYFAQLGVYAVGSKSLIETAALLGIDAGSPSQIKQMLPFAAYGQGAVTTTPLKMARVAATIAAGGVMPEGRWVSDASNTRTNPPAPLLGAASAEFLARAMRSVVTSGTARAALTGIDIPVAGKTGTAQLDSGEPHSWFAGFAPYGAPPARQIAFAVVVEHGGYGAQVAAPIARQVVEAAQQLGIIDNKNSEVQ